MKQQRKRLIAGLMFGLLLVCLLCGCEKTSSQNIVLGDVTQNDHSAYESELTFFGFKYEALNVMAIEEALHGFMNLHPEINIAYDGIKSPEYFEVLEKRLLTGNGDDIIMVDQERTHELNAKGLLADLSDICDLSKFSDLARSQMTADGNIVYLPTSISAFGFYCNLDMLETHGQKVPENLKELAAVCDYFVSQGITPIVANNDISLKTVALAVGLLPYYQEEDPVAAIERFNTGEDDLAEALLPGFELVERMLKEGWVDRDEAIETAKTSEDLDIFAAGNRPFMLTGVWAVPRVRDLEPEFDFTVVPYPILEDGSVLVINIDTRLSVPADSPHVEEAKAFVKYIIQKEVMWEFVDSQCSFSPLEDNRLSKDDDIQSINPYLTNGRCIIGSDDNLRLPIWSVSRSCIGTILEGGAAKSAVACLKEMVAADLVQKGGNGA